MKSLLNEMMKVSEDDMDIATGEPAGTQKTPVTPELIASLVEQLPELADVDQAELEKGLDIEQEHLDSVGGDMLIIAKIALDHIKEFGEKKYYEALEQMEHELKETPEEEEAEHAPGGEEAGGETPAGETPTESPAADVPMESRKSITGKPLKINERRKGKKIPSPEPEAPKPVESQAAAPAPVAEPAKENTGKTEA